MCSCRQWKHQRQKQYFPDTCGQNPRSCCSRWALRNRQRRKICRGLRLGISIVCDGHIGILGYVWELIKLVMGQKACEAPAFATSAYIPRHDFYDLRSHTITPAPRRPLMGAGESDRLPKDKLPQLLFTPFEAMSPIRIAFRSVSERFVTMRRAHLR